MLEKGGKVDFHWGLVKGQHEIFNSVPIIPPLITRRQKVMVVETKPREKTIIEEPKFRDPATMTDEELHDPDYRLKQLAKQSGGGFKPTCSKCHHCRR